MKQEFGFKKNSERMSFTKAFKRFVLIELSKGIKPELILNNSFKDKTFKIDTQDKKYYSKLMYKWRNELYSNLSMLSFNSVYPSDSILDVELNNIGCDDEFDDIEIEFQERYKRMLE